MPPELAQQLPVVKELLGLMGIKVLECEGYEADDVLGTLSKVCSDSGNQCFVLTGDRDSLQLIDENTTVLLATNRETVEYTSERFTEDYGFEPVKLIDLKALMGDSSDNISGVSGIGEKTASSLIKTYGTIEELYKKLPEADITKGVRAKLVKGEDDAKQSKWLATIVRDAPIDTDLESYKIGESDNAGISRLLTEPEMFKLMEKMGISASEGINTEKTESVPEIHSIELSVSELTIDVISGLTECSYLFDGKKLSVRAANKDMLLKMKILYVNSCPLTALR